MIAEYVTLAAVLVLAFIGHNMTVVWAAGIVIVIKALGATQVLHTLGTDGLNWGIIILTAAILVPIAEGTVTIHTMIDAFKTPPGIVAVIAGVLAAMAGGSGVDLLKNSPEVVSALLLGTMAGVFFLNGLAVGPLIAAGFTYFVLQIMKHFQ